MTKQNRNAGLSKTFGLPAGTPVDLEDRIKNLVSEQVKKTHPGQEIDLASGANQFQRAVASPSTNAPSKSRVFKQGNRNLETGAQTILEMGNAPSYRELDEAQKVAARSKCAQLCKQQGRTSCVYCQGVGFAAMGQPSRNVNKAVDQVANSNGSEFKKV